MRRSPLMLIARNPLRVHALINRRITGFFFADPGDKASCFKRLEGGTPCKVFSKRDLFAESSQQKSCERVFGFQLPASNFDHG